MEQTIQNQASQRYQELPQKLKWKIFQLHHLDLSYLAKKKRWGLPKKKRKDLIVSSVNILKWEESELEVDSALTLKVANNLLVQDVQETRTSILKSLWKMTFVKLIKRRTEFKRNCYKFTKRTWLNTMILLQRITLTHLLYLQSN